MNLPDVEHAATSMQASASATSHKSLMWFRQDLRLYDNQALTNACQWAREHHTQVRALYIATPAQWQQHDIAPIQLDFIERHLNLLAQGLASLGIVLEVVHIDSFDAVPEFLNHYCQRHNIAQVFAGKEPEYNEMMRDAHIETLSVERRVNFAFNLTDEHCYLPPLSVLNLSGEMYKVFTPFSRKWREIACRREVVPLPVPAPIGPVIEAFDTIKLKVSTVSSQGWRAGEGEARRILNEFVEMRADVYKQQRDFPHLDSTSHISPYLAIGVLSPRQCIASLIGRFPDVMNDDTSAGRTWLNELIWREFYRHLLVAFPRLSKAQNFNQLANGVQWRNDPAEFAAWCKGQTGYPIVDAAMRQLNQTGWMHNRLRMVVASFLTKHLLIDWRWGERYFRQKLIDGDLAANNGGWQWSAGCGCDAQPYFRIFNPMSQSEKFDPNCEFIRNYIPVLKTKSIKQIHQADAATGFANRVRCAGDTLSLFSGIDDMEDSDVGAIDTRTTDVDSPNSESSDNKSADSDQVYPSKIVEHSVARERALSALGVLKRAVI